VEQTGGSYFIRAQVRLGRGLTEDGLLRHLSSTSKAKHMSVGRKTIVQLLTNIRLEDKWEIDVGDGYHQEVAIRSQHPLDLLEVTVTQCTQCAHAHTLNDGQRSSSTVGR
jgi:hypothetical protein